MEQPIVSVNAVVLKYNAQTGQWEELGTPKGACCLSIYKSVSNDYRFIGMKLTTNEYVLNLYLFASLLYYETTETFHQFYDEAKNAYGFNFMDAIDAKKFGIAVSEALQTMTVSKMQKPIGDTLPAKKTVESNYAARQGGKKISVGSIPKSSSVASPYATTGIGQINDSSAAKPPAISNVKSSGGAAPPPPGPPPSAPPPPGPPPPQSGPTAGAPAIPAVKKPAANDFASQLLAASQKMKDSPSSAHKDTSDSNAQTTSVPPSSSSGPSKAAMAGPMDFLSELKLKSQKRPSENIPKQNEPVKSTIQNKLPVTQSSKTSISTSDLSTPSFVTSADLEKFRNDLMQDILSNMEKMKIEIISSISAKLN